MLTRGLTSVGFFTVKREPRREWPRQPADRFQGFLPAAITLQFDAVLFYTGGTFEMDDQQKKNFLSFVHDDGKSFIGVHSASITFTRIRRDDRRLLRRTPVRNFEAPIVVDAVKWARLCNGRGVQSSASELSRAKRLTI